MWPYQSGANDNEPIIFFEFLAFCGQFDGLKASIKSDWFGKAD